MLQMPPSPQTDVSASQPSAPSCVEIVLILRANLNICTKLRIYLYQSLDVIALSNVAEIRHLAAVLHVFAFIIISAE